MYGASRTDRAGYVFLVVIAMCGAGLLAACENPQPPGSCGTIPEQTVVVGEQAMVSACFEDPNGDPLSYRATTSDAGVATVSVSGSRLTVAGISPGTSVVTVTATDVTELTGDQKFRVLVPNRAPEAVGEIESREIPAGESTSVDVSAHFREPDGQPLSYGMSVSDEGVVTISATGSVVALGAEAKGSVTVTATATDPGGLSATQSFVVTVPNRTPVAAGSIPAQTIEVDAAATTDVTPYFTDPDGDDLAYAATSSDAAVAEVSFEGGELTVAAVAKGRATVIVTATDTEGLTATQEFRVTVPNRPPVAVGTIEGRTIEIDELGTVALSVYFTDPDGDDLAYAATSSAAAVAEVSVEGGDLTVAAVAKGAATVTVTATDTEGLTATQEFAVTVPNRPPLTTGSIEGQTIEVGEAAAMELSQYFSDPDGDGLVYSAAASDAGVAGAAVKGGVLTVTAAAKGEATVTVTAADPEGLSATQEFVVTVPNRAPQSVGSIEERSLVIGESASLELSGYFEDPDGDDLAYSASSSDAALITVPVEGGTVTVEALARGRAVATVTAADSEGLTASLEFTVAVANRAPRVVAPIERRTLEVGESVAIELSGHFEDPDGDALAYTADTSEESVVDVSVSGATVTVTALRKGEATVAVTATDTTGAEGVSATQDFTVTVPNRAPLAVGTVAQMKVTRGGIRRVDPWPHFADPDGEALVFQATSSDSKIAKAWMSTNGVVVRGVSKGTATVTITAEDAEGLTATQQFTVEVTGSNGSGSNRPPFTTGSIPAQTLAEGRSRTMDASGYFSDPDGDKLEFSAQSSSTEVVTATVSLSHVEIGAVAEGTATVTITARDPDGLSASLGFTVTVTEANVLNRPPYTVGSFSPQTLDVAETKRFSAASHFRDPDGDALRFSAQSSDNGVVTATVSGSEVTLSAAAEGTTTVVITAADPEGLTATADFAVTVTEGGGDNRPPVVLDEVAEQDLEVGDTVTVTATSLFSDPDFDELTFSATSSDTAVVEAKVFGSDFEFDAVDEGNAMVTVTAADPEGLSASQEFGVAVVKEIPNRPPVLRYDDGDLIVFMYPGELIDFDPHRLFRDPDKDELFPSVHSSDTAIVSARILSNGHMRMVSVYPGDADVTLTVRDPDGATAAQIFLMTVESNGPVAVGTMPDLTLNVGESVDVDVEPYFKDPEGGVLTYTLVPRDDYSNAIARPADGAGGLTVTAYTCGTASIEARATDSGGRTGSQYFDVVVPHSASNRDPELVPERPLFTKGLLVGDSRTLRLLDRSFRDPDPDDLLFYEAVPSDSTIVGVRGTSTNVILEGRAPGNTTVAITVRDGCGGSTGPHSQPVIVRHQNMGPTVDDATTWEPFSIDVGDTVSFDLNSLFSDPDGDPLTFAGLTAPSTKLDYVVSSGVMKVWGVGAGAASMSATAFDPFGELVELPWISVLVSDPNEDSEQLAQGRGAGGGAVDHVAGSGQQPLHVRGPRHRR